VQRRVVLQMLGYPMKEIDVFSRASKTLVLAVAIGAAVYHFRVNFDDPLNKGGTFVIDATCDAMLTKGGAETRKCATITATAIKDHLLRFRNIEIPQSFS
jgi:hypothetical protein